MKTIQGLGVSAGIAFGSLFFFDKQPVAAEMRSSQDPQAEVRRLEASLEVARGELQAILHQAAHQVGEKEAEIFNAHLLILDDPALLERVTAAILGESWGAEFAWKEGIEYYASLIGGMEDEYLAARSADVRDVGQRVLRILSGAGPASRQLERACIVVAEELTPSDTVTFDKSKVLAFCTARGGPTSHVSILSKALGIPAVTGIGTWLAEMRGGRTAIVDGGAGKIILDPDPATRQEYLGKADAYQMQYEASLKTAHEPAVTRDGRQVEVVANIGSLEEAAAALHCGAEGVGLLRTEFLFLERDQPPSEDEQLQAYRQILETFGQKPVVMRTLDIGGDKPAPYLQQEPELNPTLGLRGARLALAHPELFQTQLRALLRAGVGHNLKIMFPMLGVLEEVQSARRHLEQARRRLEERRQDYAAHVEVGIMVEIPSAALMADSLAQWVDFFSIGSNDLSQYTLAADRANPHVAGLADALDPAVLRLIGMVTRAAHARGLWVGLCGELAGDSAAAPLLLGLGVDEFSMNPRAIPLVKDALRSFSSEQARSMAEQALRLPSAAEVRAYLQQ